MRIFLLKVVLFFSTSGLFLLLGLHFSSWIVQRHSFQNYETESNLLVLEKKKKHDLLIMGISHARNFSRHKNHIAVEQILDRSILNIGQGRGACGINEQLFFLKYSYHLENQADEIIYFLSTPMLYAESLKQTPTSFELEPFQLDFFTHYLQFPAANKQQRLLRYVQTKFKPFWLLHHPESKDSMPDQLAGINEAEIEAGFKIAYGDSLNQGLFEESCQLLEKTIQLALEKQAEFHFVIPPAVFGQWPGHKEVLAFAHRMQAQYGIKVYDFSESVLDPSYYYDHHHLNTKGVVYFTERFLKPIFED